MATNRQGARAAVAAWFAPPSVAGLNTVFTSFPKRISDRQYFAGMPAGMRSGTVGIVHIVNSRELRHAIGGAHSGEKRTDYEVELQLLMKSTRQRAEDAMADFDAVVDAVVTRLRADRTLGTTDVWQAGEAMLEVESAEPRLTAQLTEIWSAVKFDLAQFNLT